MADNTNTVFSAARRSVAPMGFVLLVCFFLPWITISCNYGLGTEEITLSAYDLSVGRLQKEMGTTLSSFGLDGLLSDSSVGGVWGTQAEPLLFLFPLGALMVLGAGIGLWNHRSRIALSIAAIGGVLILLVALFFLSGIGREIRSQGLQGIVSVSWGYGAWVSILIACIVMIVVGAGFVQGNHEMRRSRFLT